MLGPTNSDLFPCFFIPHGSPLILVRDEPITDVLKKLPQSFEKPDAIVIWTAHWESEIQQISCIKQYETIHDFHNLPEPLFEMTYPCPGHPELAKEVQSLLTKNDIKSELDETRGIDHGAWTVLKLMFPEANIPVVQLSVNRNLASEDVYNIGKALAPLREKKILILGSGATCHNNRLMKDDPDAPIEEWAVEFDDWLEKEMNKWNMEALFDYKNNAPSADRAVPHAEHYFPLLYSAGAGDKTKKPTPLHRSLMFGNLTYFLWRFD